MSKDNSKPKSQKPEYTFPIQLGRYTLIELLGYGGMGEVFLAEDPICQRKVALKQMKPSLLKDSFACKRFLSEPEIAAQLSHPSIVPIYSLHEEKDALYYTMPQIEGETLHELLIKTYLSKEQGLTPPMVGSSVYALMLIFLGICQTVDYAHTQGFLHRDIKPLNIMVRNLTQVVILDWGTATSIESMETYQSYFNEHESFPDSRLTYPQNPMGTVNYMAPERAFEQPANIQSDIYSLGATLYFMLTLKEPFDRPKDILEWQTLLSKSGPESLLDPQLAAPDREITPKLSRIALRCLDAPSRRYTSVKEMIKELQSYIRGEPEWTLSEYFQVDQPKDWEFQENVLLAKDMAISRYAGVMEWVMLMLSKEPYSGNIRLKATVKLQAGCRGIGFLMGIPEKSTYHSLESSYLIWIGSKECPGTKFLRSNVEVMSKESVSLTPNQEYEILIERQNNTFRLYINDTLTMDYGSHIPVVGGHFGLLFRDADFEIGPLSLYMGSQNVQVNCLALPDAFLMIKDYPKALSEYRHIARSFKGRAEGREATFRAGITLIEIAKNRANESEKAFTKALDEFEKLHKTAGAPLEYLGKSLVYRAETNLDEESKCLELAIRMYPKHPLTHLIKEHIKFRLHETAKTDRKGAYTFALLSLRQLPTIFAQKEEQNFLKNLTESWEEIPFIDPPSDCSSKQPLHLHISIQLAFWLMRPTSLYELSLEIPKEDKDHILLLENALLSLIEMGYAKLVNFLLTVKFHSETNPMFLKLKKILETVMDECSIPHKLKILLPKTKKKTLIPLIKKGLVIEEAHLLLPFFEKENLPKPLHIWALLLSGRKEEAKILLELETAISSASPYYMLQGCYLASIKGEKAALAHFDPLIETHFPKTSTLLGHFLKGYIDLKGNWFKQAFIWEKIELYRQLALYYTCLGTLQEATRYEALAQEELNQSKIPLNFI